MRFYLYKNGKAEPFACSELNIGALEMPEILYIKPFYYVKRAGQAYEETTCADFDGARLRIMQEP